MSNFEDDTEFEYEEDGTEFEFELLNSEDGKTVTLVCHSDKALAPDEFAQALRSFADRIDSIITMAEVSSSLQ
jgi:hypothetical protein